MKRSYEGSMLQKFKMPNKKEVKKALLNSLFKHKGIIKEFSTSEEIVNEIADEFSLNEEQRNAYLETIYIKENRLKKSLLWHRLLFRAADELAKEKLVSRPSDTIKLTNKREWMLTENGYDKALKLFGIPFIKKEFLTIKSYEIQKIIKDFNENPRPINYDPFDKTKKVKMITKEIKLRIRGFRIAVIEAYDYGCSICGMKVNSPDNLRWEVEAAHIVPYSANGKDEIWNGLALCHLHHWAFDVGWFTLSDNYGILASKNIKNVSSDYGKIGNYDFLRALSTYNKKIFLPKNDKIYPHKNAIQWHRQNIFNHKEI